MATFGLGRGRKVVGSKGVETFAVKFFDSSKKGIRVSHIQAQFGVTKGHARRIIKRCRNNGVLFTPENHKPQSYFPMVRRPHVIEHLYNKKALLIKPTGNSHSSSHHALFSAIEFQKAANLLDILRLLPLSPKYIHNIHIKTRIGSEHYVYIDTLPRNRTRGKLVRERIGLREVTYIYYPSGSITMDVRCSYSPFQISTEADVNILFAFIGQIKDRMTIHLNDPRERIVPDINQWILKQCDVNVDIGLTSLGQITFQDIQISTMGRIFRAYVKFLESKSVYRLEETMTSESLLLEAFDSIVHPNRMLENQIKELISAISSKDFSQGNGRDSERQSGVGGVSL